MKKLEDPYSSRVLYDIRADAELLKQIRDASLNSSHWGLIVEQGIVVGSRQWFKALKRGRYRIEEFAGIIEPIYLGMMGDSPVVRISNKESMHSWTAWNGFTEELVGKSVIALYVNVPPKYPPEPGFVVPVLVQVRLVNEEIGVAQTWEMPARQGASFFRRMLRICGITVESPSGQEH